MSGVRRRLSPQALATLTPLLLDWEARRVLLGVRRDILLARIEAWQRSHRVSG